MAELLKGRAVTVRPALMGPPDAFGNPRASLGEPVEVPGVLVAPASPRAGIEEGRPHGAEVALSLYVPKGASAPWRGAQVEVGGRAYDVVGDPVPYPSELAPGPWGMVVEVVRHEG